MPALLHVKKKAKEETYSSYLLAYIIAIIIQERQLHIMPYATYAMKYISCHPQLLVQPLRLKGSQSVSSTGPPLSAWASSPPTQRLLHQLGSAGRHRLLAGLSSV